MGEVRGIWDWVNNPDIEGKDSPTFEEAAKYLLEWLDKVEVRVGGVVEIPLG